MNLHKQCICASISPASHSLPIHFPKKIPIPIERSARVAKTRSHPVLSTNCIRFLFTIWGGGGGASTALFCIHSPASHSPLATTCWCIPSSGDGDQVALGASPSIPTTPIPAIRRRQLQIHPECGGKRSGMPSRHFAQIPIL